MTSLEAFEEIIKVCNLYHQQITNAGDIYSINNYPIKKIKNDLEIVECFRKIPKQDLKDFIDWQIRYEKNFNIWLKEFVNGPKPIEYEENLNNLLQECDCDLEKEEPIKYLIKIKEWLENE